MEKTFERHQARLHRAYSSRWRRGHAREKALTHFDVEGEAVRIADGGEGK